MAGRYYEGFTQGEVIRHDVRRTVTETDNVLFSTLTMNTAAIHPPRLFFQDRIRQTVGQQRLHSRLGGWSLHH